MSTHAQHAQALRSIADRLESALPKSTDLVMTAYSLRQLADEIEKPEAVPESALQEARDVEWRCDQHTSRETRISLIAAALAKRDERHVAELGILARDSVAASNEIATLKNALDNCDDVYNDLREERDALRAAWAEREPQLLRAEREVEELREQLKECRAVCTREFIAKNELSDQLATARKDSELAEETIRAIQAVNVNGFGRVADLAISRLINTHYSAAMTAQEGQKP